MSRLFSPLTLRGTTFRNRAWVAPMCQYTSVDGFPTDWHLVHLGSLARGGAGLVIAEATAVTPEGRITPADAGIWSDEQAAAYAPIVDFVHSQGAAAGIQLAHAGRKASTKRPWDGDGYVEPADGGWQTVGASPLGFADWPAPRELTVPEIGDVVRAFADAAVRADAAGYDVVELHAAHGYLLHQFLSPLTNQRTDAYGGDFAGRTRLTVEVVDAVRAVWPEHKPLFVRFSATDWVEGGWTVEETGELTRILKAHGVDLVDVSSGGLVPDAKIEVGPGYQVPFARAVREASGVPTAAVGLINDPKQAEEVLADGSADAVLLARALLREPHWPLRAAFELGDSVDWPVQYQRAAWR
ncbi:2,4-dienoyl-CoA reductase-like NADH-dependent reductase (Old Yellow Enzyme family) [Motilibacter rhizosphaerae]|uniref:2,4-dienoyl-CoA reductase-like NADH-dependent reductase (Old Yellow Enzyme family) n=1 Tax=Motilibacter rhizosphaerae TaxID=598652 RepID=A0A4Q7NVP3_9ACTN|nr:NADH:flavin oxidoreductase/NADH oxidase [Motilibacter rhizosphaerae]RZS90948.1 2,4-dienoyl-CoA reductase-like NADH-dependent reductase (Old Yellow Enzyme family) [Motilibacter rhizosphaerae]